jgi:hypothetical protein
MGPGIIDGRPFLFIKLGWGVAAGKSTGIGNMLCL